MTIKRPSLTPLTSLELKSDSLIETCRPWDELTYQCDQYIREAQAHDSKFTKFLFYFLGDPLLEIRQKELVKLAQEIESARALFHHTIETNPNLYNQALEYERVIHEEEILEHCKLQLSILWDMFGIGEKGYKNQFPMYFAECKLELDKVISKARSLKASHK